MGDIDRELYGVLKDIRDYFAMQDAIQERAKIAPTPKITETQKKISGGMAPAGMKPAEGVAKQLVPNPVEGTSMGEIERSVTETSESTALKAEDYEEEEEVAGEEEPEEEEEKTSEFTPSESEEEEEEDKLEGDVELKSLLKDIKGLLSKNVILEKQLANIQKSVDKKIQDGIEKGMRKLGFSTTKPMFSRIGLDEEPIKKSDDLSKDPDKLSDDLAKKSWQELADIRIATGDLSPFPTYRRLNR